MLKDTVVKFIGCSICQW